VLVRYGGEVSIGHSFFVALGAYTVAIVEHQFGLSILVSLPIATALGARVIAVDLDDRKLEMAKMAGAADVINGKKTDPVQAVKDLTQGGADVSVDALGIAATCRNAPRSVSTPAPSGASSNAPLVVAMSL